MNSPMMREIELTPHSTHDRTYISKSQKIFLGAILSLIWLDAAVSLQTAINVHHHYQRLTYLVRDLEESIENFLPVCPAAQQQA